LSIGAGTGILFQAAAFFIPIYYVNLYAILALLLAEMSVFVVMLVKQTTMEQAALRMDCFGFEERIVTAYENLDKEGTFVGIQREDAMKKLRENKDRIQIPLMPSLKRTALLFLLLVVSVGLSLLPSAVKDRAGELHRVKEEAQEKEDEIEEFMEALEQLEKEELTEEQKEALHEMVESLESSLSEYQQAVSEEMLAAASQKLDYKYENMSDQLSDIIQDIAQDIQNGAGVSIASADAMQKVEDQLKKMRDTELAKGDAGAGNGQSGEDGEGAGNGQNGQDGEGAGNGQSGEGDGNGQNRQGEDSSSGNGRGTGSSSTPHDYVSVPNAVADSGNLTGNAEGNDLSEYFRAQNGLNWEGAHISYEQVIGSYEQNAYEGIAADRYPSGMEDIIKEYFASFNN
ncbi:MAG: hypothetical protein HDR30_11120, partial [Lachnospiraceae bacterium]|nr:hypothetical protein [Lachnospiraceae bacterium]